MSRALPALLALAVLAGCERSEPTEILLTVQSDLIVSGDPSLAEMDTVRVRILRLEPSHAPDPATEDRVSPPPIDVEVGTPVTVGDAAYSFRWARDFAVGERTLPIEIGTAPEGRDASRVALFEAHALRGGELVVSARARAGYVEGRVVRILLTLNALCRDAECPEDTTCQDGDCVPIARECVIDCDAGAFSDAAAGDGGAPMPGDGGARDAAGTDAGPTCDPAACDDHDRCNGIEGCVGGRCAPGVPPVCDDGVACTVDSCDPIAGCRHVADDARCTAMMGGRCDPATGCQYPSCTSATCVAGPCETARCTGDVCVRESRCLPSQTCCAGACVPIGCNDGNPCTDDACTATGCSNAPNARACDDGLWCNGTDTCAMSSCSVHSGSPCGARACYEATDGCAECAVDTDCGTPTYGTWSACDYTGACDESASQSRSVSTPRCASGTCGPVMTIEMRACTRDTDGAPCDDGSICTEGDSCASGACFGAPCFMTLMCGMLERATCTPIGCECVPF